MDSEAVYKAIEANLASSIWRVSGKLSLVWFATFMTLVKKSRAAE